MLSNKTAKTIFVILIVISTLASVSLIIFTIHDFFTIGAYYYEYTCLALPVIVGVIAMYALFATLQRGVKPAIIPLAISFLTAFGAWWLMRIAPNRDQFLQWRFTEYEYAVSQVLASKVLPDRQGRIVLPQEFAHLSSTGNVVIQYSNYGTTVYFPNDVELDGYSWGFLYREDDRLPDGQGGCTKWRYLRPSIEHWFFCEVNSAW